MNRPWMKFYPSNWRADPALRMCSLAARGLWAEMICIMHGAEPYGVLLINGLPVDQKQLASLSGAGLRETVNCLAELSSCGVFSRDANGNIYSRRMVRDRMKAERDKANGKSGGNPALKPGVNPEVKAQRIDDRGKKEDEDDNARDGLVSEESVKLAEAITAIVGHDPFFIPPAWFGAAYRVQTWLQNGWDPAIIVASIREQMARRKGDKPDRIQYFEKGIAAAIARQNQPLPEVKIIEGEKVNVQAAAPETRSLSSFARQVASEADALARGGGFRDEGGGSSIRVIPGGKSA